MERLLVLGVLVFVSVTGAVLASRGLWQGVPLSAGAVLFLVAIVHMERKGRNR
ncbi:hypothetical protein [Longispora albida]|uniref:hypothetical protein n=1 Tax=Longispora albida TaxID=203523 RepID=UPI000375760E|nr:hypothetical protein [Longispora albida]